MDENAKKQWNRLRWPVTIISDRYCGCYSGACWLAFPLDFDEIPEDVNGEDLLCQDFWYNYDEPVGMGGTPEDAFADLIAKMQ